VIILSLIATAVVVFAVTNIDDLFLLAAFLATVFKAFIADLLSRPLVAIVGSGRPRPPRPKLTAKKARDRDAPKGRLANDRPGSRRRLRNKAKSDGR